MIEAETGGHLWTERFDRPLDDVFALQDEIALNVVSAIEPELAARRSRARQTQAAGQPGCLRSCPAGDSVRRGFRHAAGSDQSAARFSDARLRSTRLMRWRTVTSAMCHHCLFLRGGLREEDRLASVRHAEAAIAHGRDDRAP